MNQPSRKRNAFPGMHRLLLCAAAITAAVAGVGAGSGLPAATARLAPFGELNCGECFLCVPSTYHRAPVVENGTLTSLHSYCIETVCAHPPCGTASLPADSMGAAELQRLLAAAAAGDMEAAGRLLRDHSDRVTLNVERMALQVSGCSPYVIVGHVPLGERAAPWITRFQVTTARTTLFAGS